MEMFLAPLVAVIVIAAIVWFGMSMHRRSRLLGPQRQLERMVGPEAAERLTRFERERDPGLPPEHAAKRALERAEYDRGR